MKTFIGSEHELFDFMKQDGLPVYHLSNMFLRDIQYAIRDYHRLHEGKDIGTRKSDELADAFVKDLVQRGVLIPRGEKTWLLNDDRYLLPTQKEQEEPASEDTPAEATA